ncbi:MAG: hypothetical protein IPL52_06975 [Flavobacteriales bacterium]|nr:hypothetical protein [Flavobacteriales bacterium]
MKTPLGILPVASVLLMLSACDPATKPAAPAELIIGQWQFEKMALPQAELDRLESMERAQFAQLEHQMKTMSYSFFTDGTYSMDLRIGDDFAQNVERGAYRLINDGAVLVTEPVNASTNERKTTELNVSRITADSLVISGNQREASMVFLRSKTQDAKTEDR